MASSSEEESNNNDHEMLSENSEDASVDATKGALKVAVSEVGGYKRTSVRIMFCCCSYNMFYQFVNSL